MPEKGLTTEIETDFHSKSVNLSSKAEVVEDHSTVMHPSEKQQQSDIEFLTYT